MREREKEILENSSRPNESRMPESRLY